MAKQKRNTMPAHATLFDLHTRPEGMALQLIDERGARLRLLDPVYRPTFFIGGTRRAVLDCVRTLEGMPEDVTVIGEATRRDFWANAPRHVMEVRIERPFTWRLTLTGLYRRHPDVEYFNADLLPEQQYCFDHNLVPAGRCLFEGDAHGQLVSIVGDDDPWAEEYALPSLVVMELTGEGSMREQERKLDRVSLTVDGRGEHWEGSESSPAEIIAGMNSFIERHDPDVILSNGGDGLLMPLLFLLAAGARDASGDPVAFRPDREPPPEPRRVEVAGRSYFAYGQVLYSAPDYPLYGRWHLDRRNSFMVSKTGFDGLIEVCRVSKTPIQRIGRRSIGTGITAIQLDMAYREGFLIPWKKSQPEGWKSAAQLLATDRGGLVYQPLVGAFEDVVELDFVSMYPTIMAKFNVSPETVNCRCCKNDGVPELGYTLCEKRRGLVSRSLDPIIAKRKGLKARKKDASARGDSAQAAVYDSRQSALKWLLVCCFGYLGYRNARFGRIEAHESVCAFSRDRLMQAREIAEAHGFRALHMIVDCLWLVRDESHRHLGPVTRAEVDMLCTLITEDTGITMALEGMYRWIAFLPSRQDEEMPVPNRFFGAFQDGSLKFRGIEARRSDMPPFIRRIQEEMLQRLSLAHDMTEYRAAVPELLARLDEAELALWWNEVPREELYVTRALSKAPSEYRGNNMVALAARQGEAAGYRIHAGERVSYLITSQHDRDVSRRVRVAALLQPEDTPDAAAYVRLLRRAFQTLLAPVGITLSEEPNRPRNKSRKAVPHPATRGVQMEMFLM
jgi:DNA polymerase-2